MSRIAECFARLAQTGRAGFIPYLCAGDPDLPLTYQLLCSLAEAGADLIELGLPFSDPMADGPTIQASFERALKNDFGIPEALELVEKFRRESEVPVILFGYYNPVLSYGEERLVSEAEEAGADGFLIVDLPPEEGENLRGLARGSGLDVIYLVAPTTPDDRIAEIASVASGFLYYVCVTGVTGARDQVSATIPRDVSRIKKFSDLPVAVGFGISRPDQAAEVAHHADAVVVGSAIVNLVGKYGKSEQMIREVKTFAASLATAVHTVKK